MTNRPIDVLDKSKGKRVMIKLKNNLEISGELQAFDMHLNTWLNNVEVIQDNNTIKFNKLLVRGDTILFISPVD